MTLTRPYKESLRERIRDDPEFVDLMRVEAQELRNSEPEIAAIILKDIEEDKSRLVSQNSAEVIDKTI